jgi:uncharacterized membrane protein YwaF
MSKSDFKIIAIILILVGVIFIIWNRIFASRYAFIEKSPCEPGTLHAIGWLFVLLSSVIFIIIGLTNIFPSHKEKNKMKFEGKKNATNSRI